MKTASVKDLRFSFGKVEALLEQGEEVQITKRRRVVARLLPADGPATPRLVKMPDFMARLRAIYGDKQLEVSGATLLGEDRDGR